MAYGGDFSDPEGMMRRDRTAIETLGEALRHSDKPFVSTSGTLVMPTGRETTEEDEPDATSIAAFRIPGEKACLGFAAQGVRASVVRPALEKAPAGTVLHGVAESGVPFTSLAKTIARALGLPAVSLTPDEAARHFPNPFMATVYRIDAPVSSARTRELLGWSPSHPTLPEDRAHGDYFTTPQPSRPH